MVTDLGFSALYVGAEARAASVTGTAGSDLIVFSEMDDLFIVSGGEGEDAVMFSGAARVEDFTFTRLDQEGLMAIRDQETGATFFLASDVEQFIVGDRIVDLEAMWG